LYETIVSNLLAEMEQLLAGPRYRFLQATSRTVSEQPGVYAIHDKRVKDIIYIGRTRNLRRRLLGDHKRGNIRGSQFRKALGRKLSLKSEAEITNYILENCSFQFLKIKEFEEMVRLEHFATAVIAPVLNVQLRQ